MAAVHESIGVWRGRKVFHGGRSFYDRSPRCGVVSVVETTAGAAIRRGLRPCARCFPLDPLETWEVDAAVEEGSDPFFVATVEEAIEGAPALIVADGDGGVRFVLVTDGLLTSVVDELVDEREWSREERNGLYVALCETLERLGVPQKARI